MTDSQDSSAASEPRPVPEQPVPEQPVPEQPVPERHRAEGPERICCAIITVSDTRTKADDKSGKLMRERLEQAGHAIKLARIVPDEPTEIRAAINAARADCQVAILSGGTGLTSRDSTFEVVSALLDRPIPGFGELFRMLSWQEIGAASMLSRATAGVSRGLVVFALPGSSAGVRLAMDSLIVPELGHILQQLSR